ncbi:probable rhamnogalacturonate lyase B isoform X1 [Lycium barbarum]|uniref:probable rhamnogalacturonate lyase B isoform X1 n=2 Tax=Lycium barbarum TaxID=112863 RepID=UPI00293F6FCB|nr:probable rhamnogalacturonate lyase B isoform X1 [Lycium barbarum]
MGRNMQLSLYGNLYVLEFTMIAFTFFIVADCRPHNERRLTETPAVRLDIQIEQVTMSNGFANVTLSIPYGLVTNISYGGINNLLETRTGENNRGYWDVFWNGTASRRVRKKFLGTSFEVIMDSENQVEISFKSTWNVSQSDGLPLNSDIRFVMLRDTPGFYTYAIVERLEGWPLVYIENLRVVFKLQQDMFHYMAVSDERQRVMPMPVDRDTGKVLDYKEAVLLTNPTNPDLKGEVDDKYFYANDNRDDRVHGWVGINPPVGFWMIIPSDEFRTGGPYKQDLTSHVGPIVLSVFVSRHYAGEDLVLKFQQGEPWKNVIGPVFLYLNTNDSAKDNPSILWDDAKKRMNQEVASWPYDFPVSKDYIKSNQRGTVRGQLFINDSTTTLVPASNAYVGLAPPGDVGSWQRETKGYQFWTKADSSGNFTIGNVISGIYNLYATVPGTIGDYKYNSDVQVTPGSSIELGSLVYNPPRNGATLWEIGVPDRTAAEFFVPTPPPQFKVHIYQNDSESIFRQYGLWEQYSALYPKNDLVYYVGTSNYSKDWFFAHVTRNIGNKTYEATTWSIVFDLECVDNASNYTLQLALAAAHGAELQVRFNDGEIAAPHFTTGKIGGDSAIARHGIHGLYWLYNIEVQGNLLINGTNTFFLTQAMATNPFRGVMYDYLRLEGPHQ